MIDTEILQDYSSEARELLDEMDHSLMRLEKEGGTSELLNNIFRAVHCIKGSAEYIGLERSSTLTHGVENLLDRLRERVLELTPEIIDFLFRSKDLILTLIDEVSREQEEKTTISTMMSELEILLKGETKSVLEAPTKSESEPPDQGLEAPQETIAPIGVTEDEISPYEALSVDMQVIEGFQLKDPEAGVTDESVTEPLAADPEPIEHVTTEDIEPPISRTGLEDTVSQLLNISLYLDDLQDGMNPGEIMASMLDSLSSVGRTMENLNLTDAADIIQKAEDTLQNMGPDVDAIQPATITELRDLIYRLRPFYPEETFPWKDAPIPEQPERVETPEPKQQSSAFESELLEKIPNLDISAIRVLAAAGFNSLAQLSEASPESLGGLPGIDQAALHAIHYFFHPVPKAAKKTAPAKKSAERPMLGDIDDELLSEFENIFAEEPEPSAAMPVWEGGRAQDLLNELDSIGEEADREIMEIFLSYGWEIMDKIKPLQDKIKLGSASRSDLESCAEFIKAVRSSSSYMDYQSLAAFLDDWYEKTAWAADKIRSFSPRDLQFMEDNMLRFEDFLKGLEIALNPQGASAPVPEVVTETISEPIVRVSKVAKPVEPVFVEDVKPSPPAASVAETEITGPQGAGLQPHLEETPTREFTLPSALSRAEAVEESASYSGLAQDLGTVRESQEAAVVKTMRVDSAKVDILLNQVGELVVNRSYVEQLALDLKNFQRALMGIREIGKKEIQSLKDLSLKVGEASVSLGRVATDIQEGVMKLRMLPVGQLFNRMPRLIRDLSRRVNKSVALQVHGGDTEVDKRVIEQIYNPLVHLIRNAVDHGIEDPEIRRRSGKNDEGLITLSAYSQGNQVVIDVEDDGTGINSQEIIDKAVETRLLDAQDSKNLSDQDIYNLLFVPGFSTSKKVTRTSGRGVGMDVVKKDVEKINGHIEIESWETKGTKISIKIPLTLAIIQTLLIRMGTHVFAIPLTSVREIIQISPHEIITIEGFEVIKFREETIPVLRLNEVFTLKDYDSSNHPKFLVLATTGQKTIGFLVEELIGEQDVVIKPLADHVFESRGLAGSTILGDGTIALVLDLIEIVEDVIAQQRQVIQSGIGFGQMIAKGELQGAAEM